MKASRFSFFSAVLEMVLLASLACSGASQAQDPNLLEPYQQFEAARSRGDLPAAIEFGSSAVVLAEQLYGADSVELGDALELLAEVLVQADRYADAARDYNTALAIQERQLGPDHPELVSTLEALVDISLQQDDWSQAELLLTRILGIEAAAYGATHPNVLLTWNRLRELYVHTNRPDEVARVDAALARAELTTRDLALTDAASLETRRYNADSGFANVRVFYGTNRSRTGKVKASQFYGTERGDLELGYLDVSIPALHKYGELETNSRWSIFTYSLGEDALKKKYVLLLDVEPLEKESFYVQLREHVRSSPTNDIFLFVHGYNSSFSDAARRTAQLAYDLDFDGTPMMFSWPSQESTTAYTADEAVVRVSGRKMAGMLADVAERAGAERIHVVAHSMGNRALLEALETIVARRGSAQAAPVFDQIVFTAPDVDRDYFMDVLQNIGPVAKRFTLYASTNDVALQTSAMLHGAPRAGLAGTSIVSLAGLDTIDMSEVKADRLGHSYFAANEGAIYDLFRLFWRDDPPDQRCGMNEQFQNKLGFWRFNVEFCKGGEVLEAGLLLKRFGRGARERVQRRLRTLANADTAVKDEWARILDRLDRLIGPDGEPQPGR